jgi:replicative DNA helicase
MNLTDTLPPQDLDAERSVLGSILLLNDAFDTVYTEIQAEAFYVDAHRKIFAAFQAMYEAGSRAIDAVTIRDELAKRGQLDEIGGTNYLLTILETVPHAAHADYYAKIVREKYICRRLIEAATDILRSAYHPTQPIDEMLATAEMRIAEIGDTHVGQVTEISAVMEEISQIVCERIDSEGKSGVGLPTGFAELDDKLNGLCPNNLIVFAARPGMGKTGLAGNVVSSLCRRNHAGLVITLEMSSAEIAERMLCEEAKIDGHKLRTGNLDEIDHHEYSAASARMRSWPLYFADNADLTASALCSIVRREHRIHKIEYVIVDYLQLIDPDDPKAIREQQVSATIRKLKKLAKGLKIPIIVLAQLNRGVEQREDKRPRLADLRESGAIEQDADSVLFIHRPDAYDPDDRPGEADIIIAKNRHGTIGTVTLSWQKNLMRFRDFSPVADVEEF